MGIVFRSLGVISEFEGSFKIRSISQNLIVFRSLGVISEFGGSFKIRSISQNLGIVLEVWEWFQNLGVVSEIRSIFQNLGVALHATGTITDSLAPRARPLIN